MATTKTVFVTGGSRGIGESVVRLLANEYNVAFSYCQNEEKARKIADELKDKGVFCVKCDVRNMTSVECALDEVKKRFGKVDIVVNNAGVSLEKLLIDTSEEDFENVFDVNVKGVFNVSKAAVKDMMSRQSGVIVNVASVWGLVGGSGESVYSASKAAVIGFSQALAREVALSGVRVNAIAPGAIDTDMMKAYSKEEVENLCKNDIPLGRLGKPEETAHAIKFLIENEYVSGICLPVDGLFGR